MLDFGLEEDRIGWGGDVLPGDWHLEEMMGLFGVFGEMLMWWWWLESELKGD